MSDKPTSEHNETVWRSFDRVQLRHRPAGAGGRRLRGSRSIGRSRAVRPGRRRPDRSGQTGERQRRARYRHVRHCDGDQILPARFDGLAPGALPARSRLRGQSANAGSHRRLSQGGRQGQHSGDGRARRAARDRVGHGQRPEPRRASCSSAPPRPAIRAAPSISRRSPKLAARRPILSKPEPCFRERRRPIRRKRNISSG